MTYMAYGLILKHSPVRQRYGFGDIFLIRFHQSDGPSKVLNSVIDRDLVWHPYGGPKSYLPVVRIAIFVYYAVRLNIYGDCFTRAQVHSSSITREKFHRSWFIEYRHLYVSIGLCCSGNWNHLFNTEFSSV